MVVCVPSVLNAAFPALTNFVYAQVKNREQQRLNSQHATLKYKQPIKRFKILRITVPIKNHHRSHKTENHVTEKQSCGHSHILSLLARKAAKWNHKSAKNVKKA